MTTVDEARASVLAAWHDDPDERTFNRYLDTLIAAVRAECNSTWTTNSGTTTMTPSERERAEAAQELAALLAQGRTAKPSGDTMYDDGWTAALNFIERRAALAATPAEDEGYARPSMPIGWASDD